MKKLLLIFIVMASLTGLYSCSGSSDPAGWSSGKIDQWFEKGEWLGGWEAVPDESINRKSFAVSYFRNRERWDKAFAFLRDNDLSTLELKRYDIDGNNVYAPVSEYITKNEEDARYESHRAYIDIQYVISGKELIGVAPMSAKMTELEPYNQSNDIGFFTVSGGEKRPANPSRFFIFFPDDAHMPGLKDVENSPVRKVVVKVRVD